MFIGLEPKRSPRSPFRAVEALAGLGLQHCAGFGGAEFGQGERAGGGEAFARQQAAQIGLAHLEERLAQRLVGDIRHAGAQGRTPGPGRGLAVGQGGGAIGDAVETATGVHAAKRRMTAASAGGSTWIGGVSRRALAAWPAQ